VPRPTCPVPRAPSHVARLFDFFKIYKQEIYGDSLIVFATISFLGKFAVLGGKCNIPEMVYFIYFFLSKISENLDYFHVELTLPKVEGMLAHQTDPWYQLMVVCPPYGTPVLSRGRPKSCL